MKSISGRSYKEIKINKNKIEKLKQNYNFSEIISKIVIQQNFDEDEIYSINNNLNLTNVFSNNVDFEKSLNIIMNAIKNNEYICILGDYDVDGSVATSLLVRLFKYIKHPHFFYIPDREIDGYGASKKLFEKLILKKPDLIIMVDCGSTANEAIDYLNSNKIKSVIIDHHEINKPYPVADSIINPKKNNGYKKYDYLCATALTYFFIDLLTKKIGLKINIKDYLVYVLLATVCDVMPLRKLNRLIAIDALKNFDIKNFKSFAEIYKLKGIKSKISIQDLGYLIGPILNSGGRLGKSNYATELLSSNNPDLISHRVQELIKLNEKRKLIEYNILNEIDFHHINKNNDNIIFFYNPVINEGLIGIIASRLKDYFNKPSIVITHSNKNLKGSARSIANFDIGIIIKNALDNNILINGGGHNMAGGFTLKKNKINNFKNFLESSYKKLNIKNDNSFNYISKISSMAFNKNFYENLSKLEPFGNNNPEPTFLFENLKIIKKRIINKKHISCILKSKIGYSIKSILFNSIDSKIAIHLLNYKKEINVIGQISQNFWNNKKSLQLIIKDIII